MDALFKTTQARQFSVALYVLASAFSLIPFFYIPAAYEKALLIPHNIFIWIVPGLAVFCALWRVYKSSSLILPLEFKRILSFGLLMLAGSAVSSWSSTEGWFYNGIFLLSGPVFLFSLHQFKPSSRVLHNVLYIILAGLLLHAIVALLQVLPGRLLYALIPHPAKPEPLGVFAQRNNLASAMVTGIVLSLYLCSTPGFRGRPLSLKGIVFAALFGCSMIVMMTGSRVGLLSFVIAVPLMLAARYKQFKLRPLVFVAVIFTLGSGSGVGVATSDGLWVATSKLERLADEGRDARQHVYAISWDIFTDQPLIGHGIGSFQHVFHDRAAEYLEREGGEPLIGHDRFSHPHNEILLWAIEAGILAVIGIAVLILAVIMQLYRIGWQRGGAMAALLVPIALHTQVELPFYYSHYHWLLFLFLAYLLFKPFSKTFRLKCSRTMLSVAPAVGGLIFISALLFCISTFKTSRDLTTLLYYHDVNLEELRAAQSHPYFGDFATLLTHQVLLNTDLKNGTNRSVYDYIAWARNYLDSVPDANTYNNLALAYYYIGNNEMMEKTVAQGLYFFPKHPVILSVYERTKLFEPYPEHYIEKAH